jgi:hypothetical protein
VTTTSWTQIWFDSPDEAYLVAAAIRRYLQADVVTDLLVVTSSRGPSLELPRHALDDRTLLGLVRRFGGHIEQ